MSDDQIAESLKEVTQWFRKKEREYLINGIKKVINAFLIYSLIIILILLVYFLQKI